MQIGALDKLLKASEAVKELTKQTVESDQVELVKFDLSDNNDNEITFFDGNQEMFHKRSNEHNQQMELVE